MQCSWVTCKVAGGMVLSYLQGCWRDGHQSHVFELRRVTSSRYISIRQISAGRYLRILDELVLAFGQRRKNLSRLGYCQSNCLNSWSSKVRINTVHYIWNTNNWTVKIFPVQLKFWNGPLFPTYMYLSTQNQKVICRYCENKNKKVNGPVCCLIQRADTFHFAWSN